MHSAVARILLVENDVTLTQVVKEFLENQCFNVDVESRGDRAITRIIREIPDLVILDNILPGLNGMEVCRRIRAAYKRPIMMLSSQVEESDELLGLELGADDFMAKPVKPQLLLARIKKLLRWSRSYESVGQQLQLGTIKIDSSKRAAYLDDRSLELTTAEFDLLWLLAARAGEILTRDQISHSLRGCEWDGSERSIDLNISRLRRKLGDSGRRPSRIRSIRGTGYMLIAESA